MQQDVRIAVAGDADSVAALAAATFPLACPADMVEADIQAYIDGNLTAAHFAEHIASPDADVLIHGDFDGYVLMFYGDDATADPSFNVTIEGPAFLSKCYVRPESHGSGIAKVLLEAAMERARGRGCPGMWLNVNYENYRAQRFYDKHGWQQVGYVDFKVGERVHRDPVYELHF
ncbi:MAG: GNAT family N-acetyltransferase [Propionibacterium sp.]|nr:GNAT family N-acetyltransferase [Propionibacterium sp.]